MAVRQAVVIPRRDTRPGFILFTIRSRSKIVEYLQIFGSMRNYVKAKRKLSTTVHKRDYSNIVEIPNGAPSGQELN